jgi:peptidyl-tRNA hydrolase
MGGKWAAKDSRHLQKPARNVSRNKITEAAESVGLPTFVVADAGRTEVCRA